MTNTDATPTPTHPFERANLGTAPFRVVGSHVSKYQACPGAPLQPGSSCDYCGAGIMQVFVVRGADGREFKVGGDCVKRTGDKALTRVVDETKRKAAAKARAAAKVSVVDELDALISTERARLEGLPHPKGWAGQSLLTWAFWMQANAGAAGRKRTLAALRAALKG